MGSISVNYYYVRREVVGCLLTAVSAKFGTGSSALSVNNIVNHEAPRALPSFLFCQHGVTSSGHALPNQQYFNIDSRSLYVDLMQLAKDDYILRIYTINQAD